MNACLRTGRGAVVLAIVALALFMAPSALAQSSQRSASFIWDSNKKRLFVTVEYKDAINASIRAKLQRGLPTSIVLTGALYVPGNPAAVSTTAQTCKVTWLVWDEVYQIEITRPDGIRNESSLTYDGVVRRCAIAKTLPVSTSNQVSPGAQVYLNAKVQVNPVSKETVDKIKKWVSRPSGTGTAAPGDALFSTFTGLFLQRIGDAESEIKFTTRSVLPSVAKPRQTKKKATAGGK